MAYFNLSLSYHGPALCLVYCTVFHKCDYVAKMFSCIIAIDCVVLALLGFIL